MVEVVFAAQSEFQGAGPQRSHKRSSGCGRCQFAGVLAGRAFTLIEILVVIAIIGVLAAMVVPSLPALLGGKGVSQAVANVEAAFEFAKREACSRGSYVYLAFINTTNSSGNPEIRLAAVISADGSPTNTTASNLRPLSKVVKIENMKLVGYPDLSPGVQALAAASQGGPADYVASFGPAGFSFTVGGQSFDRGFVIFSPDGNALPAAESPMFRPLTSVGLVQMKGNAVMPHDGAIVTYLGSTGRVEVVRP